MNRIDRAIDQANSAVDTKMAPARAFSIYESQTVMASTMGFDRISLCFIVSDQNHLTLRVDSESFDNLRHYRGTPYTTSVLEQLDRLVGEFKNAVLKAGK
jgi:hypothetical protein